MRNDPNGYDWAALGYSSEEAFIEAKAGASPPDLSSIICTNTEARPPTREEWRAMVQRFKDHPGFEPPPYVVVSPAEFVARFNAGEIDADGWPQPKPPPYEADEEGETAEEHYIRTCTGDAGNTTREVPDE